VANTAEPCAKKVRARHIGDFSKWKSQDGYQQAIKRVLRDLTMSE